MPSLCGFPLFTKIVSSPTLTISESGINTSVLVSLKPLQPVAKKPIIFPSGKVKEISHSFPKFFPSVTETTSNFFSVPNKYSIQKYMRQGALNCLPHVYFVENLILFVK